MSSSVPLSSGLNTLSLSTRNECGEENATAGIIYSHVVETDPGPATSLYIFIKPPVLS